MKEKREQDQQLHNQKILEAGRRQYFYSFNTSEHVLKDLPINFINSNGFNETIWDGILNIYSAVFNKGKEIQKPNFEEVKTVYTPTGGELTFYPIKGSRAHVLEVRTKISGHELFLRFKAFDIGPVARAERGAVFQEMVDEYIKEQGLELVTLGSIC